MKCLTPQLARLLGDGSELVAEAAATGCPLVDPVHLLGYLSRNGSVLRTEFLEPRQVDPERFRQRLYEVALDEARVPAMPIAGWPDALSDKSRRVWEAFEAEIVQRSLDEGSERLLLHVVLDHVDTGQKLLKAVAGSQERYEHFLGRLLADVDPQPPAEVFDPDGTVRRIAFGSSGIRVLEALAEEVAAFGYRRANALHLLFTLIGMERGVLPRAVQFQGIDPLREIHGFLSRELARPGARRTPGYELSRKTMHDSVARILEQAGKEAAKDGHRVGELHIARALASTGRGVVAEWLTGRRVKMELLWDYLRKTEPEADDSEDATRTPIRDLGSVLNDRILGQPHAVGKVLPWIKRLRFGFPRERGPAAVLLFLGPSGTGKTEMAKELARTVYGSDEHLIMIEMGQFTSKESASLFIGAPPGYVGYGEGKLTNGLRDRPRSVVLFDEVEKAHEDVWVALMRFLDEGLISDPAGPTRDGRGCVVVLTSNLAADRFATHIARTDDPDGHDDDASEIYSESFVRDEVLKYLKRPEIYNRVDDKIVFRPFSQSTYALLVQRQVATERAKFARLGVKVDVARDVLDWLTEQAQQHHLEGARCVPRLVNRYLVAPVIDVLTDNGDREVPEVKVSLSSGGTLVEPA